MPPPQEKTVCRRSTPSYCQEEKPIFPNSPWRTGLCGGLRQGRGMLLWLIMHTRFARSQPPLSGLRGATSLLLVQQMQTGCHSSRHSHTAVAIKAEAKQQRKNNGNKSYSILKLFSGSCLRENKELLPKPTLVLFQGPNMTEITPVRNFRRAVIYFQSLR